MPWNTQNMNVVMGRAFAFIHRDLAAQDLKTLDPDRHHIFCLLEGQLQIEEFTLPALPLPPRPSLLVASCDKELYYEKRDRVNLVFFDPNRANSVLGVELKSSGSTVARHQVELGANGEGALTLGLLPVGQFQVTARDETLCSFTVAAYSLAPLVGSLLRLEKETNDLLHAELRVETYGVPLRGGVWVTLRSARGGQRRVFAMATEGIIRARLELDDEGPYAIDLQHAEQADLTATIPLPGSRRSERASVPLSGLAPAWSASMLPTATGSEVRGLYLTPTRNSDSPFRLERVDTTRARLTALQTVAPLSIAVLDPVRQKVVSVHHWDRVEAGESLELVLPSPMGVLALGAYLAGQPWEGWAMTLAPSELDCEINLPDAVEAGQRVRIEVSTSVDCSLYLLVKDARLACRERPGDRLASRLLDAARQLRARNVTGQVWGPRFVQDHMPRLEYYLSRLDVDPEICGQARRTVRWSGLRAEQVLSGLLGISELELMGKVHGLNLAGQLQPEPEIARLLPEGLARRYLCVLLALREPNTVLLAMVDPLNVLAIDDVRLITGFEVEPVLAEEQAILNALEASYGVTDLVEVEETVKDISAQDFGAMEFDDADQGIALDRMREFTSHRAAPETRLEEPEEQEGEILFAGWISTRDGASAITIATPAQPAQIVVEAFAVNGFDWRAEERRCSTRKELVLALDCPPFIHQQDRVEGRLRIIAGQPPFRLSVSHDGKALDLPQIIDDRNPTVFALAPGEYQATVEEITTGRREAIRATVEPAGRISGMRRTVEWLRIGDKLCRRTEPGIFALRPLDGVDTPFQRLGRTTADYSHLCCEQTAAKILAACGVLMLAPDDHLESVIRAGIEREKTMFLPGRGFALYPGSTVPSPYWGAIAARYLCQLELMRCCSMSEAFRSVLEEGISLGRQALEAYGGSWPPRERSSALDCYLEYRFGQPDIALMELVEKGFAPDEWGRVGQRRDLCYRAALLLRSGEVSARVARMVNQVCQDFRETGGFYSTVDSIAALALFGELRELDRQWAIPTLEYEGENVLSVYAEKGDVLVEVSRAFSEDWSAMRSSVTMEVGLRPARAIAGQLVKLDISLPDGYRDGDLVWVCLPRALARLQGGGQVRRFSVDLEGRSSLTLDLVAVAATRDEGETVLTCLRNMFLEERVALGEPVRAQVESPAPHGVVGFETPAVFQQADLSLDGLRGCPETVGQMQTLSGLIHDPQLASLLEQIVERARELDSRSIILDWFDEGVARCRIKTPFGVQDLGRYPAALQTALVGRLQMLSKNVLGITGPQEGEVRIGEATIPVGILPTCRGMMATLILGDPSRRAIPSSETEVLSL